MIRRSAVPALVILLSLTPLLAQAPPEELRAAVDGAREETEAARQAVAEVYEALRLDHALVRSERWANLSGPFLEAIRSAAGAPDDASAALRTAFTELGFLSPVAAERLADGCAEALAAGTAEPDEVLAAAVGGVFAAETFEECWEQAFLDLPEVKRLGEADAALKAAEAALAEVEQAAEAPSDHPPGMVLVPRGRFEYGPWSGWLNDIPDKQNRADRVRVDAFYIDVHEVTNAAYLEFLRSLPKGDPLRSLLPTGFRALEDGSIAIPDGAGQLPVRGVTYAMAAAFAHSAGKRLPTEEEWEYAARGEEARTWPWGDEFDPDALNFKGSGLDGPVPVGSYPKDKSPFGVMDMAGNVSELTCTLEGRREIKGKLKATDALVHRGGNCHEDAEAAKTTYRWILPALTGSSEWVGFRCVMSERAFKRGR